MNRQQPNGFVREMGGKMEPAVGIEPTTDGLQNRCSTTELSWLKQLEIKAVLAVIPADVFAFAYSICIWYVFSAMKITSRLQTESKADTIWAKTPYPNLLRYKPSGTYFGRVRVNGKLIRRSLETHVLTVAKIKLSDFLQDYRRLAINKGESGKGE